MAKNELQQALDTIKKYCAQPKQKSFYEHMDNASLKQRIETLQSNFFLEPIFKNFFILDK